MQTTVVGNYPKIPNRPLPARLRQAINRRDRGEITSEEVARVADEVTIEVIQATFVWPLSGDGRHTGNTSALSGRT